MSLCVEERPESPNPAVDQDPDIWSATNPEKKHAVGTGYI